ncbi:protein kinase [Sorangium sp. So ce315]|uniref:serine/threonine-protein kinase n=1 Tax=Sorangium sp. So ce315 TaxID=3133299 RepID=UPI003F6108E1
MPERPPEPPLTSDEAAKQRAAAYLGRVISKRYRIDEVIAMGGMGAVYRGEHVHMHKRVAIKILHPETERLPELVQRFEREAIAGAHIQHRNVASATDFGEAEDGSFFLVLEYVRGTTLHEIIRRGPMPAARAVVIARQLAAALDATHAMHIVHRDLKPRNVMVVEPQGDLVKLIDFGLAKVSVDQLRRSVASPESARAPESLPARLTTAGVIFGTIAYLAPESALGMDFVDERADLYALGLIFYEMLAGKHPFPSRDPVELFNQHRSAPVPAIAEHAPGVAVPPAIEAVVRRLLEKQPRARFETAAELIAALDQACAASGIAAQEPRAEMSSRAEMTSVPAIGEAPRVPSNRPPLPSAASREPEPSPGSASAVVLGDSCLVSLNEVADALESAAQREAGGPAGAGAGAPEAERAGAPGEGGAGAAARAGAAEPAQDDAARAEAAEPAQDDAARAEAVEPAQDDAARAEAVEPAQDDAEEAPASFSRPTPVRNTPTLVAELTRDSRPTAVGGAAFMAQVAFSREEAAGGDGPAGPSGADVDELTSDSRPTAVGGAAFMAQVAFAREEAASRGARSEAADAPPSPEPSRPPEEPARSQEPALQEPEPSGVTAPSLEVALARSLAEATSKGPAGPTSAPPPLEEQAPSPEALERRPEERSSKQPSLPGLEHPSQAPVAAEPSPARPSTASAVEPSSARPTSLSAAEPSSARPSSPSAAEPSSARPSSPSAAGQPSARSTSPSAAEAVSPRSSTPSAAPASSKSPAPAAAEPAPSQPSAAAAASVPSQPPAAAGPAPSQPPALPATGPAPSQPSAPSAAAPASQPPVPSEKAPPREEPSPAAAASPPLDEPPADDAAPASEPTSERLSGSRPAFAPTLLRELEAAEAERVAREREEEARRKRAEEEARVAREREEKARRKVAAREARAAQRSQGDQGDLGARLRRIAPYLAGAVIAAGVIAALAGGGRAPPEPDPQLGQASQPASAPATSEPAATDPAAAAEPPGPAAAPPAAADAPDVPEAPAEPPPDEAGRKELADASRGRRWVKAAEALNALAERDPTALRDRAIAIAARNVAIAISKTGGELADKVFDALATRFGAEGLDVLYEIVETRGRSTPATRAAKLLRDPEVAARGTPAVRIAFELRDATCGEKLPFLDRAITEGDKRTLVVLETAVRPCYTKNRAIDEAIKTLRARLDGG